MAKQLSESDRRSIAEGIIATGNVSFGGLFVAQLLPNSGFARFLQ
jgi:protein involved in ribonucleotide reduction